MRHLRAEVNKTVQCSLFLVYFFPSLIYCFFFFRSSCISGCSVSIFFCVCCVSKEKLFHLSHCEWIIKSNFIHMLLVSVDSSTYIYSVNSIHIRIYEMSRWVCCFSTFKNRDSDDVCDCVFFLTNLFLLSCTIPTFRWWGHMCLYTTAWSFVFVLLFAFDVQAVSHVVQVIAFVAYSCFVQLLITRHTTILWYHFIFCYFILFCEIALEIFW